MNKVDDYLTEESEDDLSPPEITNNHRLYIPPPKALKKNKVHDKYKLNRQIIIHEIHDKSSYDTLHLKVDREINSYANINGIKHKPANLTGQILQIIHDNIREKTFVVKKQKSPGDNCVFDVVVHKITFKNKELAMKTLSISLIEDEKCWKNLLTSYLDEIYYQEKAHDIMLNMSGAYCPYVEFTCYAIEYDILYLYILSEWIDHIEMTYAKYKTLDSLQQANILKRVKYIDLNLRRHFIHHNDLFQYHSVYPIDKPQPLYSTRHAFLAKQKTKSRSKKQKKITGIHFGNVKILPNHKIAIIDWGSASNRPQKARAIKRLKIKKKNTIQLKKKRLKRKKRSKKKRKRKRKKV